MIDWQSVFFNGFWILGLAILLAAVSYYSWKARVEKRRVRARLNDPPFLRLFWLSFSFIGIGLAGTSSRWWETGLWVVFTLLSFIYFIRISKITVQD